MTGNKIQNLLVLQDQGFRIPKFIFMNTCDIDSGKILQDISTPMIIRSCYEFEDGNTLSFAGIFESYFPVYTPQELLYGIDHCVTGFTSNLVKTYCGKHHVGYDSGSKYLLFQEFIPGDYSGVCFTQYEQQYIYMEIIPGLNFPLVSGESLSPFSLKVHRENFDNYEIVSLYLDDFCYTLRDKKIEKKVYDAGMFDELLFHNMRHRLGEMFLRIEKLFGSPQDIEFTIRNTDIYILQSRPITHSI